MKCIAITGTTGFVGQNLVPYLKKSGFRIKSISRETLNNLEVDLVAADAVIHLAGKAHDLKKHVNPDEYYKVNFELTKHLYNSFLTSKASKFIFISSVKAAADEICGILDEDVKPNPLSDYGKSKLMAEEYIKSQTLPIGKSYYILRPCMIHGPGNKGNLNLLFKVVQKGLPYPLAAFHNERSFLSVSNLNLVLGSFLTDHIDCGIYNIADDQSLSTNDVVLIIGEALGFKSKLWKLNPTLVFAFAKLSGFLQLPLTPERLIKLTESYVVSNEKVKRALKITSFPTSSKEGLIETIISFKKS